MASRIGIGNLIEPIGVEDIVRYAAKLTVSAKRLPDPFCAVPKKEWSSALTDIPHDIPGHLCVLYNKYNTDKLDIYLDR